MEFYLSTIDPNAHITARKYGLGLEVAEYCTAWNMDEQFSEVDPQVREKIAAFSAYEAEISCFVMAGHSYEFEVLHQWEYMEDLLKYIKSFGFECMTTMEFVKECYPQGGTKHE